MQRIFVVDDEQVIADTLSAILKSSGYDAIAFYDAETALAACEHQRPDFVITDVSMPGMNGIEMGVEIRNRFPECGVLLFSGNAATSDLLEKAKEKGCNFDVLTKPVHPKELLARLESAIRRPIESQISLDDPDEIAV
ncbi:MAG TPA: response regulator [Terracidiphilus sp.]|nr:response regulator [Terracidiphilus sp.]